MKEKKIFFVFAPIFLHWPLAFINELNSKKSYKITTGGFIGGANKYFNLLKDEGQNIGNIDDFIYTHELESKWIEESYKVEDLDFFRKTLGDSVLNQLVIADRHIGNSYLFNGGISSSPFLKKIQDNKDSHLNYLINMLRYLYDYLNRTKPDLFYSYAVAGSFTLAIAELCNVLGIKFAKLTHSRISDRIVIDTSPRDNMERVEAQFANPQTLSNVSLDWATNYLNDFREKQVQPDYQILQNNIYKAKTTYKHQAKLWAKRLKGTFDSSNNFFHNSYNDIVKYEQKVVKGIKKFWKDKPYYSKSELLDKKFFFYPLHVDPEASTMVISPYQTNQLSVIEAIAKSKPIDTVLIVKEHLTMIGRRPKDFYNKINKLPGVYLVDPREPSFEFTKNAQAIITLTGTAGFEAVLLGKPAIFLGNFIYKFIKKGFVLTGDLTSLSKILENVNDIEKVEDDILVKLLASIYQVSIPFDGGLIWSGVSKERVEKNPQVVKRFSEELVSLIS